MLYLSQMSPTLSSYKTINSQIVFSHPEIVPLLRIDTMYELDRTNSRRGSPRSPRSSTLEQTLDTSKWTKNLSSSSSSSSSSRTMSTLSKDEEAETENGNQKKSFFAKMKETAKKLQQNLSPKKKHSDDSFKTSWGVNEQDNQAVVEEDPEYLGAPMYESEKAPEELKETARQHPRANPVISKKNVLPVSTKQDKDEPRNILKKTLFETVQERENKPVSLYAATSVAAEEETHGRVLQPN